MKVLDLINNNEQIFVEDVDSKKVKTFVSQANALLVEMKNKVNEFANFIQSEKEGEFNDKAVIALSLAEFYKDNRYLRLDNVVATVKNEETAKINTFYFTKTKLLDALKNIAKISTKEAVVCRYDLFNNELTPCEVGHEIIILKDRNSEIIPTIIKEIDEGLVAEGIFDTLSYQDVEYNTAVLDKNIALCNAKNAELHQGKESKFQKAEETINKLYEMGKRVVAFYTYKDALFSIGCNAKGIKAYENELSHGYVPLKKALQKEFRIELDDICATQVNEESYPTADENFNIDIPHVETPEGEPVEEQFSTSNEGIESIVEPSANEQFPSFGSEQPSETVEPSTTTNPTANNNSNPFDI